MAKLSITRLLRIPSLNSWPGSLSVSPDGRYAAVNWNKSGTWEIWLVPLAGKGALPRARRVTSGPGSKSAPRFSPDGRKLAYLQDHDGDENYDVFVYDLAGGTRRNAMPGTPEALYDHCSWSPDGRHLAIITNRAGRFAVHVLDTDSGEFRRLTDHAYSDVEAEWSPDGRWVAVSAMTRGQDTSIFITPAGGGEARPLADGSGPIDAAMPRWSPDGRRLAFVGWTRGLADVGIFDLESGEIDWVGTDRWDEEHPAWSPDGRHLAHTVNRDGDLSLVVVDLQRRRRRRYAVEPGVHVEPLFTPDGRSLLCVFHNARRPADLWRLDLAAGRWKQLTKSLPPRVRPGDFVMPEVVRWKAPDGLPISGLLFRPKRRGRPTARRSPAGPRVRARRRPVVINVHGGPAAQYLNLWSPVVQAWVNEGWAVLCPNYRGSTGYGKAFQTANRFVMGQADIADVVAGADYLVRRGLADRARVGLTGTSYGGYLTLVGLTKYPGRFAVGSAVIPFVNWFTEFESEREDLRYWDLQNMGDPREVPDRFREASPAFYLDRIAAPVQMIAGANDPRCPAAETRGAAAELARLGKIHEALIFPDEGHGILKLKNKLTAYQRQLSFLRRHLGA